MPTARVLRGWIRIDEGAHVDTRDDYHMIGGRRLSLPPLLSMRPAAARLTRLCVHSGQR